jgi:hypothetical protein
MAGNFKKIPPKKGKVTTAGNVVPKTKAHGGFPTKSHALLNIKTPAVQPQKTPGTPPAKSIRAPQALGKQAQAQVNFAEAKAAEIAARHRSILGVTRSVFPSLYGNDGRPKYQHGMQKQVIRQTMASPYKSSFTFGPAKF